jgi:L-lysine epsilon oxidase C-terminal domain
MPEDAKGTNDRDKWASLTQLQYDRLTKWAEGDFKTGSRYDNQKYKLGVPGELTLAVLKWTTGAPLFPGIEVYWVAQLSSMYDLKTPFRI